MKLNPNKTCKDIDLYPLHEAINRQHLKVERQVRQSVSLKDAAQPRTKCSKSGNYLTKALIKTFTIF